MKHAESQNNNLSNISLVALGQNGAGKSTLVAQLGFELVS